MSFDWKLVQSPLEGVTASQLEAVFGSPEVVKIEAGSHISLAAEAPRTAYLVLSGALRVAGTQLGPQGWGRIPAGEALIAEVGPEDADIWLKDAPLQHADILPMPA